MMSIAKGRQLFLGLLVVTLLLSPAVSPVDALSPEAEARREARRVEREARRAQRDAEREARRAAREEEKAEEENQCKVSVSFKWSDPTYSWQNGQLIITPRADVKIKSRGDFGSESWVANLNYEGQSRYESRDIDVPAGVSFSGSKEIARGFCGFNYNLKGLALDPIVLTGIDDQLLMEDEKLKGEIDFAGVVAAGNDSDSDTDTEKFTLEDGINLK